MVLLGLIRKVQGSSRSDFSPVYRVSVVKAGSWLDIFTSIKGNQRHGRYLVLASR